MHQIIFRLWLRPRPCWELTPLPQTPYLDLRGLTSKKRGKKKGWRGEVPSTFLYGPAPMLVTVHPIFVTV